MAESYGFFNSAVNDMREYNAEDFAELFSSFFSSGISNEGSGAGLKVTDNNLDLTIGVGYAIIKGYYYKNDTPLLLGVDGPDPILNRIDRVVLRLDLNSRTIKVKIKKGNTASTPIVPSLERSSSAYELGLAQVKVIAKSTKLVITDERLDKDVCGLISIAAGVPDQEMWDKFNRDWSSIKTEWNNWYNNQYNKVGSRVFVSINQPGEASINDIWIDI